MPNGKVIIEIEVFLFILVPDEKFQNIRYE
jgi:hypothetical protein